MFVSLIKKRGVSRWYLPLRPNASLITATDHTHEQIEIISAKMVGDIGGTCGGMKNSQHAWKNGWGSAQMSVTKIL